MESGTAQPATETSSRHQRESNRVRAPRRRLSAAGITLAALITLLVLSLYAASRLATPRLAPPKKPPLAQPGGTLRQLTASDVVSMSWSSDGKSLALAVEDTDNAWRYLGPLTWYRIRKASAGDPMAPYFFFLALVGADGTSPQAFRIPGRYSCEYALWQPGGSRLSVVADRLRILPDGLEVTPAVWLFDLRRHRFYEFASCVDLTSWSPDGRSLLCGYRPRGTDLRRYRVVGLAGAGSNVPVPAKPDWVSHARWSPDSRFIAFRYRDGGRTPEQRASEAPSGGIWLVDLKRQSPRLVGRGEVDRFLWLPDGRLMVARWRPTADGRVFTRMGVMHLDTGGIEWFRWQVPYRYAGGDVTRGRCVLNLSSGISQRDGQVHYDLWELSLSDGRLRRLTNVGFVRGWRLSPSGDKVALTGVGPIPGLWILDIKRGGTHPADTGGASALRGR